MNAQVRPMAIERRELCNALRFDGDVLGIDRFGESAPAAQVTAELGLTAQAVCARACALVRGKRSS
jgi:transketolase